MATIVFASSKGGVGKTTSALVLATTLAEQATVTLIDADPNWPMANWLARATEGGEVPEKLKIVHGTKGEPIDEDNILDFIKTADAESQFVIVDLAGVGSMMAGYAIGLADLVIAPMGASQVEADESSKILKVIQRQEISSNRRIPFRALFTRSPAAIRTRNMDLIQKEMKDAGLKAFENHLHDREAYRTIFTYGATLRSEGLENLVSSVPKAILNAALYTQEVVQVLRDEMAQSRQSKSA